MKNLLLLATAAALFQTACNNQPGTASTASSDATPAKPPDAVQLKLQEYAGNGATNCGRLEVKAKEGSAKAAADCAMQASQKKQPFFVAYDMPGMVIGVAGNAEGKLLTARSEGDAVSSGACPAVLRLAASGRVTCYAPGDMGSMGAGHTAIPQGMPNPHAMPKPK